MAKKGCEMFDNVIVLRTGEYFASENTFSAYFNENNSVIDPHEDIEVFANTIAPMLNVSMRFFGTEKNGSVTYQFNEICQSELKKYHIEPVIIERKTLNDQSISASTVRKLLSVQDYAGLLLMLPQYSFELLKEIY